MTRKTQTQKKVKSQKKSKSQLGKTRKVRKHKDGGGLKEWLKKKISGPQGPTHTTMKPKIGLSSFSTHPSVRNLSTPLTKPKLNPGGFTIPSTPSSTPSFTPSSTPSFTPPPNMTFGDFVQRAAERRAIKY